MYLINKFYFYLIVFFTLYFDLIQESKGAEIKLAIQGNYKLK